MRWPSTAQTTSCAAPRAVRELHACRSSTYRGLTKVLIIGARKPGAVTAVLTNSARAELLAQHWTAL
jgi:hypothetical protein